MVRIVEVGPRDGLQNESILISTAQKAEFIRRLSAAGLREIEATSFVSPKWIPQLGDAEALWPMLPTGGLFSALVPNAKGLERALALGVNRIALFTAASDDFCQRNINMSIEESLLTFADLVTSFRAVRPTGWIRGYLSTAFECPIAGLTPVEDAVRVAHRLVELGVDEVAVSDTLGVAVPSEVRALAGALGLPRDQVAWHFHDTRGTAIANVGAALDLGYATFDASAAGIGGCPYAQGAGGNLATEDLVYFLERSGIPTEVDPHALASASLPILAALGRSPSARAQQATLSTH